MTAFARLLPPVLLTLVLTGCGVNASPDLGPAHPAGVAGQVHGGQQPVAGATIQLYAVNTSTDGGAATPLLTQTVTTDAGGNFEITGLYSCSNATYVYMVATGGDPGLGANNPNLAMMTALGRCSTLTSATYIAINELTTVAAVYALAPYMTSYAEVGATSSHGSALALAFSSATELVGVSSGAAPGIGVPSGYGVPVTLLNTLADMVSGCVNSGGGAAGDSSFCGHLFKLTTLLNVAPPTDTVGAVLNLADYPNLNTDELFSLVPAFGPFQPSLSVPPPDFTVRFTPPASKTPLQLTPIVVSLPSTPKGSIGTVPVITIKNTSSSDVDLSGLSLVGSAAADLSGSTTCPVALAGGNSCLVQLSFSPVAVGTRTAWLQVTSNSGASPQFVQLSGAATDSVTAPHAVLSATAMNFATGGLTRDLSLSNSGTGFLAIRSIGTSGTFAVTNDCGDGLQPGAACTISVLDHAPTHDPHSLIADSNPHFLDFLTVVTNDADYTRVVPLSANNIAFTPATAAAFAPTVVGVSSSSSVTMNYIADMGVPLPSSCPAASVADADFAVGTGSFTTTAATNTFAATCVYPVTFTPSAVGNRIAKLVFDADGAYLPLYGAGAASVPAVQLAAPSYAFAFPATSLPVVLTNSGSAAVSIQSIVTTGTFSQTNTCGASLAANASCTISVTSTQTSVLLLQTPQVFSPVNDLTPGTLTIIGSGGTQTAQLLLDNGPVIYLGGSVTGRTSPFTVTPASLFSAGSVSLSSSLSGDFHGGSCTAVDTGCSSPITFRPTAASPYRTSPLTITDSTSTGGQMSYSYTLQGSGFSLPVIVYFGEGGDYIHEVGLSGTIVATLTNAGSRVMNIVPYAQIGGIDAPDFAYVPGASTCGSLALGANCTIQLTYHASKLGESDGTFTFTDANSGDVFSFPLVGFGTNETWGPPSASPSTVTFPSTPVGASSAPIAINVTVSANHGVKATVSAPFSLGKSSCDQDETPCQLTAVFTPSVDGIADTTLVLTDVFTGFTTSVPISGQCGNSPAHVPVPAAAARPSPTMPVPHVMSLSR